MGLLPVLLGNPDPAVGDLVQVDQIVGLNLARLSQPGDYFLDQLRVIFGKLNRQGGYAFAVDTGQHGQATVAWVSTTNPFNSETDGYGLNSAATRG
jgi:hypothetical protein